MNGDSWQAVICGVGGQGVLYVNRMLALTARAMDQDVLVSEVHGMAQRGGSVVSHLRAGNFRSPLVPAGQADLLFSLEKGEAMRNASFLRPRGRLVVNAPNLKFLSAESHKILSQNHIKIFHADIAPLAQASGFPANILLLAAASKAGCLPVNDLKLRKIVQSSARDGKQALAIWQHGAKA